MESGPETKSVPDIDGGILGPWAVFCVAWLWIVGVCLFAQVPGGWPADWPDRWFAIAMFFAAFVMRAAKQRGWGVITYLMLLVSFLLFFISSGILK